MDKKEIIKNKYKLQRMAIDLLEGPIRLFPPEDVDYLGILIPCLKIREMSFASGNKPSSFGIYVDNTVNREEDFLTPMLRYAEWDRQADLYSEKDAPSVTIIQHILSLEEQDMLHNLLIELDKNINNIRFLVGGLITDRGDPQGTTCGVGFRDLIFSRYNSAQEITFNFGQANNENIELEVIIRNFMKVIKELCLRGPLSVNYGEKY